MHYCRTLMISLVFIAPIVISLAIRSIHSFLPSVIPFVTLYPITRSSSSILFSPFSPPHPPPLTSAPSALMHPLSTLSLANLLSSLPYLSTTTSSPRPSFVRPLDSWAPVELWTRMISRLSSSSLTSLSWFPYFLCTSIVLFASIFLTHDRSTSSIWFSRIAQLWI